MPGKSGEISKHIYLVFYLVSAVILSLLNILLWLAYFLLTIYSHFIITSVKIFDNCYFENTASFLERRYTQY